MLDRYPLTVEQLRQTTQDVAAMCTQAEEIAELLCACYGESDQRTIRAQEAHAALHRFQIEMGREHAKSA
jgi:prophage tail gpP-like protein